MIFKKRVRNRHGRKRGQGGQAMIEYLLLLGIIVFFTRFVFFHPEFGFFGMLNRTILRLGVHLESNLKTATKRGGPGRTTFEQFSGAGSSWNN